MKRDTIINTIIKALAFALLPVWLAACAVLAGY